MAHTRSSAQPLASPGPRVPPNRKSVLVLGWALTACLAQGRSAASYSVGMGGMGDSNLSLLAGAVRPTAVRRAKIARCPCHAAAIRAGRSQHWNAHV